MAPATSEVSVLAAGGFAVRVLCAQLERPAAVVVQVAGRFAGLVAVFTALWGAAVASPAASAGPADRKPLIIAAAATAHKALVRRMRLGVGGC
ncbi:hypothetical protein KGA66_08655 [Actinocrinis puniceicyclus]|uniref:Uncharacterized protein n=1 Tax=Actinocrinis puniceicyclus TaxID=977794 RepID=A0A8J8BAM4_9ACTN|nr:hypothetical protein [Actinocrinis puniceicyclus]MBS2963112.1 hypothetical protein [Actinocrinis puniceicyclus]